MFIPDEVEYWSGVPDSEAPFVRIWAEVMLLGIHDAACWYGQKVGGVKPSSGHERKARSQAYWWMFDDTHTDAGSFIWGCRLFNIDPHRTREGLLLRWEDIVKGQQKFNNKKNKEE